MEDWRALSHAHTQPTMHAAVYMQPDDPMRPDNQAPDVHPRTRPSQHPSTRQHGQYNTDVNLMTPHQHACAHNHSFPK